MSIVLGISGKIGSGKTVIANFISKEYHFRKVSFGDYLRFEAEKMGLGIDRLTLQNLGEKLIEKDARQFCLNVLSMHNWDGHSNLIIDGIRHVKILEIIKDIVYPIHFYLIYTSITELNRKKRLSTDNLSKIDNHSVEKDVAHSLYKLRDFTINTNRPLEKIEIEIKQWVYEILQN